MVRRESYEEYLGAMIAIMVVISTISILFAEFEVSSSINELFFIILISMMIFMLIVYLSKLLRVIKVTW